MSRHGGLAELLGKMHGIVKFCTVERVEGKSSAGLCLRKEAECAVTSFGPHPWFFWWLCCPYNLMFWAAQIPVYQQGRQIADDCRPLPILKLSANTKRQIHSIWKMLIRCQKVFKENKGKAFSHGYIIPSKIEFHCPCLCRWIKRLSKP